MTAHQSSRALPEHRKRPLMFDQRFERDESEKSKESGRGSKSGGNDFALALLRADRPIRLRSYPIRAKTLSLALRQGDCHRQDRHLTRSHGIREEDSERAELAL